MMKRRDILKDNLPIFHQAAMGTIGLDIFEIDYLKFRRFGVKIPFQIVWHLDKALDFCRFAKSAKIYLQLMYCSLRSG